MKIQQNYVFSEGIYAISLHSSISSCGWQEKMVLLLQWQLGIWFNTERKLIATLRKSFTLNSPCTSASLQSNLPKSWWVKLAKPHCMIAFTIWVWNSTGADKSSPVWVCQPLGPLWCERPSPCLVSPFWISKVDPARSNPFLRGAPLLWDVVGSQKHGELEEWLQGLHHCCILLPGLREPDIFGLMHSLQLSVYLMQSSHWRTWFQFTSSLSLRLRLYLIADINQVYFYTTCFLPYPAATDWMTQCL